MSPREYEAYQLYVLAEAGVVSVRLLAPQDPQTPGACLETDGVVMTIEEAMLLQPIPHDVNEGEVCRCTYGPAVGA